MVGIHLLAGFGAEPKFKAMALVVVLAVCTSSSALSQDKAGQIEGHITGPNMTTPIPSVQVTLFGPSENEIPISRNVGASSDPANERLQMERDLANRAGFSPNPSTSVLSDAAGTFRFSSLAPGHYQIRALREGYLGGLNPGEGNSTVSINVVVVAGPQTPNLRFIFERSATISGIVLDPSSQAATNAKVTAYRLVYPDGQVRLESVVSSVSNDRGEYRIFGLARGDYYVGVTPQTSSRTQTYARTYFPGTTDARFATRLHLEEGEEIRNGNINIRSDATGKITGQFVVSGGNGEPISPTSFVLKPRDPAALWDSLALLFPNSAADKSDGHFEIRGVLPGAYELIVPFSARGQSASIGRTFVDVGAGSTDNVKVFARPGIDVKVRLTVDGKPVAYELGEAGPQGGRAGGVGVRVPVPAIQLRMQTLEPYVGLIQNAMSRPVFDPSGIFTFANVLESQYRIQVVNLPQNSYVIDVQMSGKSIYDEGFLSKDLKGGIEVSLSSSGFTIQGTSKSAYGSAHAFAQIVLVPELSRRKNSDLYHAVFSDSKGQFKFAGVAPGKYKLFAWGKVATDAWLNTEFIGSVESQGIPVLMDGKSSVQSIEVSDIGGSTKDSPN